MTADDMVNNLHDIFENAMESSYERKNSFKKSSEPPWINQYIRQLIRKRRAIFRIFGRNAAWKAVKNKTKRLIKERKKGYNKKKKESILQGGKHQFHECVRSFLNNDKKKDWSPDELYPGASEADVAENLAAYFNNISSEYEALKTEDIPNTYDMNIPTLTEEQVKKEIKEGKKPKARVKGDLFCDLLVSCLDVLVKPITVIYNCITLTATWPKAWKTEYVTVIPK